MVLSRTISPNTVPGTMSTVFRLFKSSSSLSVSHQNNARNHCVRPFSNFYQQNQSSSVRIRDQNYRTDYHNRWNEWKKDGTLELVFGYSILACVGADYLLDKLKTRERKRITNELRLVVHTDELKRIACLMSDTATTSMIPANAMQADASDIQSYDESSYRGVSAVDEIAEVDLDNRKVLFRCRVCRVPGSFDGTRSLRFVEEGDVVEVLGENVGPGGGYNQCRHERVAHTKKVINAEISLEMHTLNDISINENKTLKLQPRKYDEGWFPMTCLEKIQ